MSRRKVAQPGVVAGYANASLRAGAAGQFADDDEMATAMETGIEKHNKARAVRPVLAILASLTLVVLAVMASLALMQGINEQIDDMTRTYEGRNQARELTLAIADAESAQLGYVLTAGNGFRELYARALGGINEHALSLKAVVARTPLQADRVKTIVDDIDLRVTELARAMDLMRAQQTVEARALINIETGGRTMDPARLALEQFIGEENQKLLARKDNIDATRPWLVATIVVALVGAVVLVFLLLLRAQRKVRVLAHDRKLLRSKNEILEGQVRQRTLAVEEARMHAERERQRVETLLQDTNHRIGNSLATVSSLLALQLLRSTSEEVRQALDAARSRVHAIAAAHRRLRLGGDMETTTADDFLDAVLQDLAGSVPDKMAVKLAGEIDPIEIKARDATTIGILVGELVTNALKHAFPDGRGGCIDVQLKRDPAGIPTLSVSDNGVGIEDTAQLGESGLGSVIIKQLARQFGGKATYESGAEGGLRVIVPLPGIEPDKAVG